MKKAKKANTMKLHLKFIPSQPHKRSTKNAKKAKAEELKRLKRGLGSQLAGDCVDWPNHKGVERFCRFAGGCWGPGGCRGPVSSCLSDSSPEPQRPRRRWRRSVLKRNNNLKLGGALNTNLKKKPGVTTRMLYPFTKDRARCFTHSPMTQMM